MGPHLNTLYMNKLSMSTRMSAARKLLEALESLHKGYTKVGLYTVVSNSFLLTIQCLY